MLNKITRHGVTGVHLNSFRISIAKEINISTCVTFKYPENALSNMKFYTTGKVAEMLGVHKMTVIRWIRSGKIKALRIGKVYRIPESELKRILGEFWEEVKE